MIAALRLRDGGYVVPDADCPGEALVIKEVLPGEYWCECRAMTFQGRGFACTHIRAVIAFRASEHAESQIGAGR